MVDWNRQHCQPDNATLLMRYDQAQFEAFLAAEKPAPQTDAAPAA